MENILKQNTTKDLRFRELEWRMEAKVFNCLFNLKKNLFTKNLFKDCFSFITPPSSANNHNEITSRL